MCPLRRGLLIAGDVALPRLEWLQRQVGRLTEAPTALAEQGLLVAEAFYVQALFQRLPRPLRPEPPRETRDSVAWVTFLWGQALLVIALATCGRQMLARGSTQRSWYSGSARL